MEKTGEILEKYIRKEMSQVELSELMDVSPQYISNIVNNLKKPSEKFLKKFYNIFEVSEEDKEKIEEYEEFRKMPEKIREEVMLYRKRNKSQDTKIDFNLKEVILRGEVDENDNMTTYEKKERLFFSQFETDEEKELFGIVLKSNKYFPQFQENDILIFEKYRRADLKTLHKQECLIEYKDKKLLKSAEYINNVIIFKSYCRNDDTLFFLKLDYETINVIGVLRGVFRKY